MTRSWRARTRWRSAVEPTAAEMLDDKQLDATVVGEEVNFSIGDQAEQTG